MPRERRARSKVVLMSGTGEVEKKRVRLGFVRWEAAMERVDWVGSGQWGDGGEARDVRRGGERIGKRRSGRDRVARRWLERR